MIVLTLDWQQAALLAVVLLVIGLVLARVGSRRARTFGAYVRESAVIAGLYALWQLAGSFSLNDAGGAFSRARWIERSEHSWGLPSERDLLGWPLHHAWWGQFTVLYYDVMHFTTMGVFLAWLFWRHRDRYPAIRTTLALVTAACLLVQLVPVAPPRKLPGFVDVARVYGRSVYAVTAFGADQLSAMPSVHVAWATLVGVSVVVVSTSRWRWLALFHPVFTVYVVVATANHWWLDGLVAIALLALSATVQVWVRRGWRRLRAGRSVRPTARPEDLAAV